MNYGTLFRQMTPGETYKRVVLVLSMENRTARTGKPFVALKMTDGDSTIGVNYFGSTLADMEMLGIEPGSVADIEIYIKEPYYNLADICLCDDPDVTVDDFIRTVPIEPQKMFKEILEHIEDAKGVSEQREASKIALKLLESNRETYMHSAAAKSMHHNLTGGLIYHSYRMVLAAEGVCDVYESLDRELLISAAAIHDIGKISELTTEITGASNYTVFGRLFGHTLLAIEMIDKIAIENGYTSENVQLLKHCVASHHGKPEWGAVTNPAIPEAMVLNLLDMVDAEMYKFEEAIRGTELGKISASLPFFDGRTVYRPYGDPIAEAFAGLIEE